MTEEEKLDGFEKELLPSVRDEYIELMAYFEAKGFPSAYTACLGTYLENFMSFRAVKWKEHCENYGITMDKVDLKEALEKIQSLDMYVEDFR
jgi:hypothetical protein